MQKAQEIIEKIKNGVYDEKLAKIYGAENTLKIQKARYTEALLEFIQLYGNQEASVFSAPGRSEIAGNHTDHQFGKVLAASVDVDTIAVVSKRSDTFVKLKSEGYLKNELNLSDLSVKDAEKGTTTALIRGVAAGFEKEGFKTGGFNAYVTSEVLSGSGLSSSAAFEVLIGKVFSELFNDVQISAVRIAEIAQFAENAYFGKPSGLMDQLACSAGGLVFIDFKDPEDLIIEKLDVNFQSFGHRLCIIDAKGSHSDLTDDYAQIPLEMRKVASYFGVDVLREVDENAFYNEISLVRSYAGDRAVLRAMHFFDEEKRVEAEKEALKCGDFNMFKQNVLKSGRSSFERLQNIYSAKDSHNQCLAIALAFTEKFLQGEGAFRVHGGGFAGTIEAFIPEDRVPDFKEKIERIFGGGSCHVLKIRREGSIKVI